MVLWPRKGHRCHRASISQLSPLSPPCGTGVQGSYSWQPGGMFQLSPYPPSPGCRGVDPADVSLSDHFFHRKVGCIIKWNTSGSIIPKIQRGFHILPLAHSSSFSHEPCLQGTWSSGTVWISAILVSLVMWSGSGKMASGQTKGRVAAAMAGDSPRFKWENLSYFYLCQWGHPP